MNVRHIYRQWRWWPLDVWLLHCEASYANDGATGKGARDAIQPWAQNVASGADGTNQWKQRSKRQGTTKSLLNILYFVYDFEVVYLNVTMLFALPQMALACFSLGGFLLQLGRGEGSSMLVFFYRASLSNGRPTVPCRKSSLWPFWVSSAVGCNMVFTLPGVYILCWFYI